jgi:hypothetical protein
MSSIPRYGDEVRILIFDDPSEQERGQSPKFCFAQLYSTRVYTTVDLNLDAMPSDISIFQNFKVQLLRSGRTKFTHTPVRKPAPVRE